MVKKRSKRRRRERGACLGQEARQSAASQMERNNESKLSEVLKIGPETKGRLKKKMG